MKEYTTIEEIENYKLIEIDLGFHDQVEKWIEEVEAYIDGYTQRSFDKVTETRYFDGSGGNSLLVDDLLAITSVELGDKYADDFQDITDEVLPYPTAKPSFKLIYTGFFTSGYQNVKVVGEWGFESVPEDIKRAATILVSQIIDERADFVNSEKIGNYQVSYESRNQDNKEKVNDILRKYKRYYL